MCCRKRFLKVLKGSHRAREVCSTDISINDGYDSKDYVGRVTEIDVAFKQLLYDFYSEDLLEKVKTSLKTMRESRKHISSSPCYGYVKNKTEKYKLEVDEEVAINVRRIYREYLAG